MEGAAELLTAAVEQARRRPRHGGDLRVRVRPDGGVRVRRLSHRYTTYPRLHGRLERGPAGQVHLVGVAVENGAELFLVLIDVVLGLGLFAVFLGVTVDGDYGGMLVCGAGALTFGWLARAFHRGRRTFPSDVDELVDVLHR